MLVYPSPTSDDRFTFSFGINSPYRDHLPSDASIIQHDSLQYVNALSSYHASAAFPSSSSFPSTFSHNTPSISSTPLYEPTSFSTLSQYAVKFHPTVHESEYHALSSSSTMYPSGIPPTLSYAHSELQLDHHGLSSFSCPSSCSVAAIRQDLLSSMPTLSSPVASSDCAVHQSCTASVPFVEPTFSAIAKSSLFETDSTSLSNNTLPIASTLHPSSPDHDNRPSVPSGCNSMMSAVEAITLFKRVCTETYPHLAIMSYYDQKLDRHGCCLFYFTRENNIPPFKLKYSVDVTINSNNLFACKVYYGEPSTPVSCDLFDYDDCDCAKVFKILDCLNDPKHQCSGCVVDADKKPYLDSQLRNPRSSLVYNSLSNKYHSNKCRRIVLEGRRCDKCSNIDRLYRKRQYKLISSSNSSHDEDDNNNNNKEQDDNDDNDDDDDHQMGSTKTSTSSSTSASQNAEQQHGLDNHALLSMVLVIHNETSPLNKELKAVLSGDKSGKLRIWWQQQISALIANSTNKENLIR